MKTRSRMLVLLMLACLLLSAFTVAADTQQTSGQRYQPALSEVQLPEEDQATGTLVFYLNGKEIYAGCPVSELTQTDIFTYTDLETEVQPWHMSEVVRVQLNAPDTSSQGHYAFFVAMNAGDSPCPISECVIYSITINCENGIEFGSGNEEEHFITGKTTYDELVEAYGEPDATESNYRTWKEIFYYEPFSGVSFSFKDNVVRQVSAYYSANVYGALADSVDFEIEAGPMEKDALILMSQYLDVTPYLKDEDEAEEEDKADKTETQDRVDDKTGILSGFDSGFQLDGKTIDFGCVVSELPEPFREDMNDLPTIVNGHFYVRTGRNDPEEFFLINNEDSNNSRSDTLLVKGIVTESNVYRNWGVDNSGFHSFVCQGITETSTIEDVLELFGAPRELVCSSGERTCFAWMHYETEAGDTLHVRVDPMLDQVVEVQMSKHFDRERSY